MRNGASYQGLHVFPICVTSPEFEISLGMTTLEDGLKTGRLEACETAHMSYVHLRNRGETIAVMSGETLIGGAQNRMINCGVVLSGGESSEVASSCVELHRWDCKPGKDEPVPDDKQLFGSSDAVFGSLKKTMLVNSIGSMRTDRKMEPDQKKIWECITEAFGVSGARTKTLDLHDLYEFWESPLKIFSSRFALRPGQVGTMVFTDRNTWFVDIFGDSELLYKNFRKLLKGYSLDTLLNIERSGAAQTTYSINTDTAKSILKSLKPSLLHPLDPVRHRGSYFFDSRKFCGTLLTSATRLTHLSACSK